MQDIFKHNKTCILRVLNERSRKKYLEKKMTENFPNLRKMLLYIAKKLNEFQVGDMQRSIYKL